MMSMRTGEKTSGKWETVKYNGNVWRVYGKTFPGEFRVYRVEGDVTSPDLPDALQLHADALGLASALDCSEKV